MSERSFVGEVVTDSSGTWAGNALRFATADEAALYVRDLARRWTLVRDTRVRETDDPITHRRHDDGRLEDVRLSAPQSEGTVCDA